LGNGYPIAAIIGKADIMQAAQSTFISSTNWTERIGPSAAIAMIKKKTEHIEQYLHAVNEAFAEIASAIKIGSIDEKLKGGPSSEGFKRLT